MTVTASSKETASSSQAAQPRESVVVRFAGDSGDGMQLAGSQFTSTSAIFGNDVSTFPDFPAEIRAPAGTVAGVSGFQVHFSSRPIKTPGDRVDCLVAMNPAALKTNLRDLIKGGTLIVNTDGFVAKDLRKAGYEEDPLDDQRIEEEYRVIKVPMTSLNRNAVGETALSSRAVDRSKNFFALGLVYWLYDRSMASTLRWIEKKFAKAPEVLDANTRAHKAGYHFGETLELAGMRVHVAPATSLQPGTYRHLMGNQAVALGLATAAKLAGKELIYSTYPITPASDILHELAKLRHFRVRTLQLEDEIAAMAATVGSAFGGALAATGTSGPGLALKSEAIGLAIMTELPMLIINVQRGGPSTGLPTKTEQSDLLQAMYGRNGESPLPVLAIAHPADSFHMVLEAFRIAVNYMTPVMLLSDSAIANGAEPWRIPDPSDLSPIVIEHPSEPPAEGRFRPYARNDRLCRPWAIPGTSGYEHRVGGLEKEDLTGDVSYDPDNHQRMVELRAEKVAKIVDDIPEQEVNGPSSGELLVVSWGSCYGAVSTAAAKAQTQGKSVAHCHLRYLNPFPMNLGAILGRYRHVLVPELNLGQLRTLLRARYLVDAKGYNKVKGQPLLVSELLEEFDKYLPN